jgi:hypothetical protein
MVTLVHESEQIVTIKQRTVNEDTAAHDVEQHIGAVVSRRHPIARNLKSIGASQKLVQTIGVGAACLQNFLSCARATVQTMRQFKNLDLGLWSVKDHMPFLANRVHRSVKIHQERATPTPRQGLGVDLTGTAKTLYLVRRQQCARSRRNTRMPGGKRLE